MNLKKVVITGLLAVSGLAFAEGDAQWGVKELKVAADSALEKFKTDSGEDLFASVVGFGIDKNIQGTAGKFKLTYKDAEGVKQTVSYFCHNHGPDEIDCH